MLRVRVVWSGIGGTPFLSTFYFSGTDATSAANAVTACGVFLAAVDTAMDSELSWAVDQQVAVIDETSGLATASFTAATTTGAGASGSDSLPFVSQVLLRLRTGVFVNGREIRGRIFLPGETITGTDDGVVDPARITTVDAAAATLIGDANSNWVVWSRQNGQAQTIASASTWNQFATLRTRRPSL